MEESPNGKRKLDGVDIFDSPPLKKRKLEKEREFGNANYVDNLVNKFLGNWRRADPAKDRDKFEKRWLTQYISNFPAKDRRANEMYQTGTQLRICTRSLIESGCGRKMRKCWCMKHDPPIPKRVKPKVKRSLKLAKLLAKKMSNSLKANQLQKRLKRTQPLTIPGKKPIQIGEKKPVDPATLSSRWGPR